MDLQEFLGMYAPLSLIAYDRDNTLFVAIDSDNDPFIIFVKIRPNIFIALTNYEDPGIASNEFYIVDNSEAHNSYEVVYEDNAHMEHMCLKAIYWAVRVKQVLKTTDDYQTILEPERHPFLRAIYDQYFYDLNLAIAILADIIAEIPNYD